MSDVYVLGVVRHRRVWFARVHRRCHEALPLRHGLQAEDLGGDRIGAGGGRQEAWVDWAAVYARTCGAGGSSWRKCTPAQDAVVR